MVVMQGGKRTSPPLEAHRLGLQPFDQAVYRRLEGGAPKRRRKAAVNAEALVKPTR